MIIMKKAIPRRTILHGLGAALALPLLDAMVPALANSPAPNQRLGIVYVPNGMRMDHWTPGTVGTGFEFPSILKPMEPYRDKLRVLTGLNGVDGEGPHARASTRFLTGVASTRDNGSNLRAGISMDQIAGRVLGKETQLATLELAIDGRDFAGSCDEGFSCAYTNTLCWANETTPLPMENNPRVVFERLFGDSGSTNPEVRKARLSKDASLLDSVTERASVLARELGVSDQTKLDQYLDAVRDVERRIQMAESQGDRELPVIDQPPGIPDTFAEHARLMFDMMALAFETDMTRVVTFMMGREITGRTYAEIGVPDAHHPISHHQNDPEKLAKLLKINQYHVAFFAEFLERLRTTPDGDGSLLDNSTILYGAGMADSNSHYSADLPILLAGSAVERGGYHLQYPEGTPITNLHLTLLDRLNVPIDALGDATGRLPL